MSPKLNSRALAVNIALVRKVPLHEIEDRLDTKGLLPTIHCAGCHQAQPDEGRGQTCCDCGCSPLPSYDYPKDSPFYPRPYTPKVKEPTLEEMVQRKRAERGG